MRVSWMHQLVAGRCSSELLLMTLAGAADVRPALLMMLLCVPCPERPTWRDAVPSPGPCVFCSRTVPAVEPPLPFRPLLQLTCSLCSPRNAMSLVGSPFPVAALPP